MLSLSLKKARELFEKEYINLQMKDLITKYLKLQILLVWKGLLCTES